MTGFLDWDEIEKEIAENNRRISDSVDTEKQRARSKAEFDRGVALGWFDKDGNSLLNEETDDENEDEE